MSLKQDIKLKYVAIVLGALSLFNLLSYLTFNANQLLKVKGKVTAYNTEGHYGNTRRTSRIYYTSTTLQLNGDGTEYKATEKTNRDSLLRQLKVGDDLELYTFHWYQFIYYMGLDANFYYVKKNDAVVYDITDRCRGENKVLFFVFGAIAVLFTLMYLDQVKNISISNLIWKNRGDDQKQLSELEKWKRGG